MQANSTTPFPPLRSALRSPRLLWRTLVGQSVEGAPALFPAGDRLFVPANDAVCALDAGGRTLWTTPVETAAAGGTPGSPVVSNNRVYVGTSNGASGGGALLALDARTGRIAWRFSPAGAATGGFLTRPAVAANRVLVESTDNSLYAIAAKRGTREWRFVRPDGSLGYSDPLPRLGALYICGESFLYRLDPETGRERWRARLGGKSLAGPAEAGGRVFAGGDGSGLSAVDAQTGRALWSFGGARSGGSDGDWFGAPVYAAGTVYVGTYARYVHAVDALSGRARWTTRLLGPALSAPVFDAARNVVYVASETFRNNPTLWALDARTGAVLFNYRAGSLRASPVLDASAGRLYAGARDGYVYAFALAQPPPPSPPPRRERGACHSTRLLLRAKPATMLGEPQPS